jgi:hypothetical protein
MPTLLTANAKIRKSAKKHGIALYNFGIPAYKSKTGLVTCPAAGTCKIGCYAQQGAYIFGNVAPVFEWRLQVTLDSALFLRVMTDELFEAKRKADKQGKRLVIRIHDSGDFYSVQYWKTWEIIIKRFPDVHFYAYTKQVKLFRTIQTPTNFRLIFSEGGLFDSLIDRERFHARVFPSPEALEAAGYADASADDLVAGLGDNPKIGLVYHGAQSKEWTTNEKEIRNAI